MRTISWNRCFICSSQLDEKLTTKLETTGQSSLRHNKRSRIHKTLLQYLVPHGQEGADKSNDERKTLVRDILNLYLIEKDDREVTSASVRFCSFCEQLAEEVNSLHLQLEVIQMKLIDKLETVKQCVISNSRLFGTNEGVRIQFQKFEDWLDQQANIGTHRENERTFLELLHRFQSVVFESDIRLQNIPLVYIHKYTGGKGGAFPLVGANQEGHAGPQRIDDTKEVTVKEEVMMRNDYQDEFEPLSFLEADTHFDEDEDTPVKDEPVTETMLAPRLSKKKRGRGKKRKVKSTGSVLTAQIKKAKLKTEKKRNKSKAPKSEDTRPTRVSCRAAASEATKRLNGVFKPEVQTTAKRFKPEVQATAKEIKPDIFSEAQKLAKEMKMKIKEKRVPVPDKQVRRKKRGLVTCEECSFECNIVPRMEQHFMEHEGVDDLEERKYKCPDPDCKKTFRSNQFFEFHVIHHCGALTWRCDICAVYIRRQDMKTHVAEQHASSKLYPCDHCSLLFVSFPNLVIHCKSHNKAELKYCLECADDDECKRPKFATRQQLLRHLHEDHGHNEIALKCNVENCSATFYNVTALQRHKSIQHERTYPCEICNKAFEAKSTLENHHRIKHQKIKKFQCEHCPEKFAVKPSLDKHLIRDHNMLKYQCDLCPDIIFTEERSFNCHMKKEHDIGDMEYLQCKFCSRKFLRKDRLKRHEDYHTDNRDFICNVCGFMTKTKGLLRNHMISHGFAEKKHACHYCEKSFAVKRYLRDHLRTHTKETPYQCETCGASFSQRGSLNLHKKNMHLKRATSEEK